MTGRKARRCFIGGLAALVLIGVGYSEFVQPEQHAQYESSAPTLTPELEAMRSHAFRLPEARPAEIGSALVVLRSAHEEGVSLDVTADHGNGARVTNEYIEVGTAKSIVGCTVAVLESRPGPVGDTDGSQSGSALVAVDCSSPIIDTARPSSGGIESSEPSMPASANHP